MAVNLSIKNVPDELADRLRKRAERNRRSLQGELLVILEEAEPRKLSVQEVVDRVRSLGLRTPSESTRMVRRMRDER
jgi:antitoxin FitA